MARRLSMLALSWKKENFIYSGADRQWSLEEIQVHKENNYNLILFITVGSCEYMKREKTSKIQHLAALWKRMIEPHFAWDSINANWAISQSSELILWTFGWCRGMTYDWTLQKWRMEAENFFFFLVFYIRFDCHITSIGHSIFSL